MSDRKKDNAPGPEDEGLRSGPRPTELRFVTPDMCVIHLGSHGALHVTVANERIYGGVYAAYDFPVHHDERYISLIQSRGKGEDVEIGIIRDLSQFPADQTELIREALARRYFMHTVTRINRMGWEYGFVSMDVETDKGRVEFLMKWQTHRAVDYGPRGKVLIDVDENRYLIPDLSALSPAERNRFTRIIYW